jgi:hypothetical protein
MTLKNVQVKVEKDLEKDSSEKKDDATSKEYQEEQSSKAKVVSITSTVEGGL